jgi:hypothetical protein
MERGRAGGEKNVQASPDLELGAPEPRKNRGPRRLRKSPGKGTGIRRLFPEKVQVSSQNSTFFFTFLNRHIFQTYT